MSDKYEEVFNLESIKEKLIDWQTEEAENVQVEFWPLDIRRVEWLIKELDELKGLEEKLKKKNEKLKSQKRKFMHKSTHHRKEKQRYREVVDNLLNPPKEISCDGGYTEYVMDILEELEESE